jgi:hypothetical protein
MFNLDELFEFIFGQAGVIGPVIFFVLLWALWRAWRRSDGLSDEEKFLIAYIIPPFIIISTIAFISRANANWAAVAYPGLLLLVTGSLFSSAAGRRTLVAATLVNIAIGARSRHDHLYPRSRTKPKACAPRAIGKRPRTKSRAAPSCSRANSRSPPSWSMTA